MLHASGEKNKTFNLITPIPHQVCRRCHTHWNHYLISGNWECVNAPCSQTTLSLLSGCDRLGGNLEFPQRATEDRRQSRSTNGQLQLLHPQEAEAAEEAEKAIERESVRSPTT